MSLKSTFTGFAIACTLACVSVGEVFGGAEKPATLQLIDVFELEFCSSPQISPDGRQIVYVRNSMDIMSDRGVSSLWTIQFDGQEHRPLVSGKGSSSQPAWSPDGSQLAYVAIADGRPQLYVRWLDTGQTAKLTDLTRSPNGISWSPDGHWLAFSMLVPSSPKPFVKLPSKPKGAEWAKPAKVIRKLQYRADGRGYLEDGYSQLFVVPSEGGTPRQITEGPYQHQGALSWSPDSKSLIFSANRHDDWEYNPVNSEVYEVSLDDGSIEELTSRLGPDRSPVLSPDGQHIAYTGFDDRKQGYQVTLLYVMKRDGSGSRVLTPELDRSVGQPVWSSDSKNIYFQYADRGNTRIAKVSLDGDIQILARDVGGMSLGRPYGAGSFSISKNDRFAFTHSRPDHPADVAVGESGDSASRRITHLNEDLFAHKELAPVEELWWESSFDRRRVQGWIAKPPGFDPSQEYPLILEIHGGPFADYGDRFAAEVQLYAAAGYIVLYTNPRGSTSYGAEFGNLIHHNYPGEDYDDLMSGVDAVIAKGYVDAKNLFVTGGSGGGVLSSWIVGKTDRFRAAVVAKPVINWYSFVLTSDNYSFFYQYWFPGFPWDYPEHYLKRSPLSLVGNVKTPTMLLTGEADHRTPISESEQYYQALKLLKVDAALVRIPDASHGITARPSNLISKVAHVLKWFETYRDKE